MTQNKFLAEFAKLISITNLPKKRSFSLLLERFHPYPLFATVFSWYFYILCKPHVHCVALCSPHNLKGLLFGAGLLFLHKTYLMCQAMYLIFDLLHAWHIFLHLFNEKKHDKGKYNMPFCAYDCKKFFVRRSLNHHITTASLLLLYEHLAARWSVYSLMWKARSQCAECAPYRYFMCLKKYWK